jgi:hypothetical protein
MAEVVQIYPWHMRGTERLIDGGRVACPRERADVDIERCYTCPFLLGLQHAKSGDDRLSCGFRPPSTLWE